MENEKKRNVDISILDLVITGCFIYAGYKLLTRNVRVVKHIYVFPNVR